jgi:quercetin dioxygenase-like cupin family protein
MSLLKDLPVKQLTSGIAGHYLHGSLSTLGLIEIKKGSDLPAHQHPHEQITYIIEGQLNMTIGGVQYNLSAGMGRVIPPNTPHSAIAVTDCLVIDAFSPVREDYK